MDDGGEPDGRRRDFINLAGLIFIVALVAGGLWLFNTLSENAKFEDCLMSGRTNCNPIQTSR